MALCAFLAIVACSPLLAAASEAPPGALGDCGAHGCDDESLSLLAIKRHHSVLHHVASKKTAEKPSEPAKAARKFRCPDEFHGVFADVRGGNRREISLAGGELTIKPSGSEDEEWTITATWDPASCSAMVDFNVKGKPKPPPVPLLATLWGSVSKMDKHFQLEFTDPSGTMDGAPSKPVDLWLGLEPLVVKPLVVKPSFPCPTSLEAVYDDIHDRDQKEITISGTSLTIRPRSGNGQKWEVHSVADSVTCSAVIDFNVSGKPGIPPVDLLATFRYTLTTDAARKTEFVFSDPSGTLAAATDPLNCWVERVSAEPARP